MKIESFKILKIHVSQIRNRPILVESSIFPLPSLPIEHSFFPTNISVSNKNPQRPSLQRKHHPHPNLASSSSTASSTTTRPPPPSALSCVRIVSFVPRWPTFPSMDDLPSEDDRDVPREKQRGRERGPRSFPFFTRHPSTVSRAPRSHQISVVPRDEPFSKNALSSIVGDSFRQAYAKWKLLHIRAPPASPSRPTFVF